MDDDGAAEVGDADDLHQQEAFVGAVEDDLQQGLPGAAGYQRAEGRTQK